VATLKDQGGDSRWVRHTVSAAEAGRTVQEVLIDTLRISRRMIQRLTRSRGVTLNSRPAYLKRQVRAGDVIAARISDREEATLTPAAMDLAILYEDTDLIALDKLSGVLVHPTSPHHTATLAHGIANHYREQGIRSRVRPVHRLDLETSGVLLIARSAFAHQHLDRQLREGTLSRLYLAIVEGRIDAEDGTIDDPIGRSKSDPRLRAARHGGQSARTRFEVVDRLDGGASAVRISLDTGRTHQIRVHFAGIGHPVVADRAYGAVHSPHIDRPALHSERLRFQHPRTGNVIDISAPLPADIAHLIDRLRSP
jgi:23S rRNA pseudouridine1911/1915/1917 synthase